MKYFTIPEFERSVTAALKGYDNEAPREARRNIGLLVDTVLDPLREALGRPVVITSGYRCADLNRDVGGSPTSQHLLGLAADFRPLHDEDRERVVAWFGRDDAPPFDQLIIYPAFFHVGLRPEGSTNRRQLKRYNAFGQGYRKD